MSNALESATEGLLFGGPLAEAKPAFPRRLEQALAALPGELASAVELLEDADVGKSEQERFELERLGRLAAEACLARHNPHQARREGRALPAGELSRWRAEALRLLRALNLRRSVHSCSHASVKELLGVVGESLRLDAPEGLCGSRRLQALLDAAGLGELEIVAAYSTGNNRTVHALARDRLRTLCGRPPGKPEYGWVPDRRRPGWVKCRSCAAKLDRAAREPLDLATLIELIDRACVVSIGFLIELKILETAGPDWPRLERLVLEWYLERAADELLEICRHDVEGGISRALTGVQLHGHPKLSGGPHSKELAPIFRAAVLNEPEQALCELREGIASLAAAP